MNIKKLVELDKKQSSRLDALRLEHNKLKANCDAMREKLPQILIEKGQSDADTLASELNKMSMLVEAQETAIHQLESQGSIYYTDKDVLQGFKEYAAEYNLQFDKLHTAYIKCLDEAFSTYKKLVELRKSAKSTKSDYKAHLREKNIMDSITLATLDIRSRSSKDSVANFLVYYGNPNDYPSINKNTDDRTVFFD